MCYTERRQKIKTIPLNEYILFHNSENKNKFIWSCSLLIPPSENIGNNVYQLRENLNKAQTGLLVDEPLRPSDVLEKDKKFVNSSKPTPPMKDDLSLMTGQKKVKNSVINKKDQLRMRGHFGIIQFFFQNIYIYKCSKNVRIRKKCWIYIYRKLKETGIIRRQILMETLKRR